VRKKRRAVVKVKLSVSPAAGGTVTPYTKKATVKAAKRKLARR
jgi:hypothetical protein